MTKKLSLLLLLFLVSCVSTPKQVITLSRCDKEMIELSESVDDDGKPLFNEKVKRLLLDSCGWNNTDVQARAEQRELLEANVTNATKEYQLLVDEHGQIMEQLEAGLQEAFAGAKTSADIQDEINKVTYLKRKDPTNLELIEQYDRLIELQEKAQDKEWAENYQGYIDAETALGEIFTGVDREGLNNGLCKRSNMPDSPESRGDARGD